MEQERTHTVYFREVTKNRIDCGFSAGAASLLHEYRGTGLCTSCTRLILREIKVCALRLTKKIESVNTYSFFDTF
jgi:hypothetical protein